MRSWEMPGEGSGILLGPSTSPPSPSSSRLSFSFQSRCLFFFFFPRLFICSANNFLVLPACQALHPSWECCSENQTDEAGLLGVPCRRGTPQQTHEAAEEMAVSRDTQGHAENDQGLVWPAEWRGQGPGSWA